MDIKNLSAQQKEKVFNHYTKEFSDFIEDLNRVLSQIIYKNDALALVFLIDIFSALSHHAITELNIGDENIPKTISGWPTTSMN